MGNSNQRSNHTSLKDLVSSFHQYRSVRKQPFTTYMYKDREQHPRPANLMSGISQNVTHSNFLLNSDTNENNNLEWLLPEQNIWSDFDYNKISQLSGLAEPRLAELHHEFLSLATSSIMNANDEISNNRVTIDFKRFRSLFSQCSSNQNSLSNDLCRKLFNQFDIDKDNRINFCEFVCAYVYMQDETKSQSEREMAISKLTNSYLSCCNNEQSKEEASWLAGVLLGKPSQRLCQTASF